MHCPKCNAQIFQGDKFCGECGANVSSLSSKETFAPNNSNEGKKNEEPSKVNQSQHITEDSNQQPNHHIHSDNANQQTRPVNHNTHHQSVQNEKVNGFFKDTLNFIKDTFKSPTHTALNARRYSPTITIFALAVFVLINSLVFTGMLSSLYGSAHMHMFSSFPFFGVLIRLFIVISLYLSVLYAVGLALSMIFNKTIDAKTLLNQYSSVFIISVTLNIISLLFALLGSFQLYAFFMLFGLIVLVFTPLYVFLINSENKSVGLDKLYISILHFLAIGIGIVIVSMLSLEILSEPVIDFLNSPLTDFYNF